MIELPTSMAEVTPAWLQSAVGEHAAFAGTRIVGLRATPVGVGIGQVGDLARVELEYADAPGPAAVVVKLHTSFAPMRAVGVRYDMYVREAGFYQSLAVETKAPTPAMYFVAWNAEQERNAMVMQDLSAWHWPDQVAGATAQQAARCIDALAQLAAGHWNADFTAHTWLPGTDSELFARIAGDYQFCLPITLERLQRFISPAQRDVCAYIGARYAWLRDALAQGPQVLTHVDCRLENFVFNGIDAEQLALIDWQLVTRMRPGFDFAYFVGTSLTEEARAALVPSLTQRYLDGLQQHGVRDYDASAFAHDFRLGTMAMTMIPVIGGASFDDSNPRSLALFSAMLSRALASVLAYDCVALLPDAATN